jgi:hypothetical protein
MCGAIARRRKRGSVTRTSATNSGVSKINSMSVIGNAIGIATDAGTWCCRFAQRLGPRATDKTL